jgi:hypothetical protein
MKTSILLIGLIFPFFSFSQPLFEKTGDLLHKNPFKKQEAASFDPARLTYGGNFGLQFGTSTYIDISPMAGYRLTEKLVPGVGVNYVYFSQRYPGGFVFRSNLYGVRAFTRYDLLDRVFIYGEYELLNWDAYDFLSNTNKRVWYGSPIVGGGYLQPSGNGSAFMVYVLYAASSQDPASPYFQNPLIFRVGFMIN